MENCNNCGVCAKVCPMAIIKKVDDRYMIPEKLTKYCSDCGSCAKYCPNNNFDFKTTEIDNGILIGSYTLDELLKSRYSCRNFKSTPVKKKTIINAITTANLAPSAKNGLNTDIIVLGPNNLKDLKEIIHRNLPKYKKMVDDGKIEKITYLVMSKIMAEDDKVTHNAPHVAIFSHDASEGYMLTRSSNANIAATYFNLALTSLKIGSCWLGFLTYIINLDNDLKNFLGINDDVPVFASIGFGHPSLKIKPVYTERKKLNYIIVD